MTKRMTILCLIWVAVAEAGCTPPAGKPASETDWSNVRVGMYESRAVALAYGRSTMNDETNILKAEHDKAKAAGDTKRMKELEAQAGARQHRIHRQVFGDDPIDDIMELIKDDLPKVARAAGVNVIVRAGHYHGPPAEMVDITDRLVALFKPDEKTLRTIEELLRHPPVDIKPGHKCGR